MAGHISEEDLLSGIELLPTTEPTTPSNLATAPHKEESSILEDSISSMKGASSHQSPDKLPSSYFTTSVHEVQKKLRDSLASSLRREAEMKSSWFESPGEVRVTSEVEKHNGHSSPMKLDTPIKVHVDDTATTLQSKLQLLSPSEHVGPNICLSSQFPSGISPIKTGGGENLKSPFSENTNPQSNEDINTQQLLTFIKHLEKGPKSDQTVASQLSQLSVLLKQSTDLQPRVSEYNPTKKIVLKSPSKPEMKSTVDMVFKSNKFRSDSSKSLTSNRDKTNRKKKSTAVLDQDKHVSLLKPKVPTGKSVQFFQQESKPNSKKIKKRVNNTEETSKSEISCRSVNDMLVVRNHLQTMLNLRKVDAQALDPPAPDLYNNTDDSKNEDTFRSTDTATLLRTHPSDLVPSFTSDNGEISAEMTDSLTSDVFSMLKTNKQRSTRSSVDSSISAENGILRDTLEKEKYRRQHCEKQIQKLQKKMLEIQQELAVAHSVDKKKDLMIEQLDKTLAKVVEGWKSHESNLVKSVEKLTKEGESWKEESVKLKEMVVGLENELAKSLEELVNAKETIVRLQEGENRSKKTYQKRTEEINKVIDQKNEQMSNLETQNEDLNQRLEKLGKQIKEQSSRFESEKKEFLEKDTVWEETVFELE
uniref:Uncharacterized protein n=1 Tax=Ciona savignyi TaxID=51511 RepID=H2YQE7_CIOSA